MPPFLPYTTNSLNVQRAIDIQLMTNFAGQVFEGDATRVVYSDNSYCFRRRTDAKTGLLDLPFMNIYCKNWEYDYTYQWYTFPADKYGVYLEDIQSQLHLTPIKMTYEASLWFERDDDLKAALNRLIRYRQTHEQIVFDMNVYNAARTALVTVDDLAIVNFDSLGVATDFVEKDWLEKNQIRSIAADFSVYTFAMHDTHDAVCIPNNVLFEFAANYTDTSAMTYDEVHTFVVDHVLEKVTEV